MEDLDPPREMAGAAEHILRTLEAFGFEWDGAVAYQSRRYAIYEAALGRLKDEAGVSVLLQPERLAGGGFGRC